VVERIACELGNWEPDPNPEKGRKDGKKDYVRILVKLVSSSSARGTADWEVIKSRKLIISIVNNLDYSNMAYVRLSCSYLPNHLRLMMLIGGSAQSKTRTRCDADALSSCTYVYLCSTMYVYNMT
jgi:hypothetical protein